MSTPLQPNTDSRRRFAAGEVVFAEGAEGDTAFIIERGQVEVSVERNGQTVRLAVLGPGEIFGEMSLIDDRPRTATVRCITEIDCVIVDRGQIQHRLRGADVITGSLLRLTLNRFRSLQRSLRESPIDHMEADPTTEMMSEAASADYQRARDRLKLERELRNGFEQNQFFIEYQPIVALKDGSLRGYEALVRWQHPEFGRTAPDRFIELAEESGLIHAIDHWVMRHALKLLETIRDDMGEMDPDALPWLSINLSGMRFVDADVVKDLRQIIETSGIPAHKITIEITEGVLIRNPELALAVLNGLKELGLSIALDDFGTGYSSLSYLQRFPIDTIKIDLTFIQKMQTNETSLQIVRAIIGLAQALNIKVVAEGVELPVQARLLRDLGADCGQGYLYSRALTTEAARAYALGNMASRRGFGD
ncbi:MAG: EAL domain-containing protein [Elsteraceae bacterium]